MGLFQCLAITLQTLSDVGSLGLEGLTNWPADSYRLFGLAPFQKSSMRTESRLANDPSIEDSAVAFSSDCRTSFLGPDLRSWIRAPHADPLFTSIKAHAIRVQR